METERQIFAASHDYVAEREGCLCLLFVGLHTRAPLLERRVLMHKTLHCALSGDAETRDAGAETQTPRPNRMALLEFEMCNYHSSCAYRYTASC
jgi:hypothetical protein